MDQQQVRLCLHPANGVAPGQMNFEQDALHLSGQSDRVDDRGLGELLADEQTVRAYGVLRRHATSLLEQDGPALAASSVELMQTVLAGQSKDADLLPELLKARRPQYSLPDHMVAVGLLTLHAARVVESDPRMWATMAAGAMLADIGKAHADEATLLKEGRLPPEEWKLFLEHPSKSAAWLSKAGADSRVVLVAAQHHEHLDGRGYPFHLRDEAIHPWSRLHAIVDTFATLTAARPFRRRLSPLRAIWLIQAEIGRRFDSAVFAGFRSIVLDEPCGSMGPPPKSTSPLDSFLPLPWLTSMAEEPGRAAVAVRHHERRRFPRLRANVWCRIQVLHPATVEQANSVWVRIHELSRGGIGFAHPTPLGTGQGLAVYVPGQTGGQGRLLKAVVLHCRRDPGNLHIIGARFEG